MKTAVERLAKALLADRDRDVARPVVPRPETGAKLIFCRLKNPHKMGTSFAF
jgi:hypothetical protein